MDISVLLATHRRDDRLRSTLESFTRMEPKGLRWEALVIDNAGEASTRVMVEAFRGALDVKYVIERTPGKNNALNTGLSRATGSLFVFTDDDVIVAPDWLARTWEGAARWATRCVFGGRILPCWPPAGLTLPLSADDPALQGALGIADWDLPEGPMPAIQVRGANMSARASVFGAGWRFNPAIGPRSGDYIMGSETEFTVRLERTGLGAVYLPGALVRHQVRAEQLQTHWLYRRSFRNGRGLAFHANYFPSAPRLFGVPRFLWKQLAVSGVRRLIAVAKLDNGAALRNGMDYWRWRGYLHQCRVASPAPNARLPT
jgi:glycosyltransferase involved in cell wall biosynthesis